MRRPISNFLIFSILAHVAVLGVSGYVFITRDGPTEPIKVSLTVIQPVETNEEMDTGKIEEFPEPLKKEVPSKAEFLSRHDSKAKNVGANIENKSKKTAIPMEKITPPPPAKKKWKKRCTCVTTKSAQNKSGYLG